MYIYICVAITIAYHFPQFVLTGGWSKLTRTQELASVEILKAICQFASPFFAGEI